MTAATALPTVDLLGFQFHRVTEEQCVKHILDELDAGRGGWVLTPNLDILRLMSESTALGELFRRADLMVADGMPIVWASRLLGDPLPERVAGSSLVSTLSAGAAERDRSLYLVGGDEGTAEAAAKELRRRHPALRIVGTECPPWGFEADPAQLQAIHERIEKARPDIVYVALGCPKQERVIQHVRSAAPQAWYLGVGISFSYLCGRVKRAPRWMRAAGLEWVYRLAQEPGRLFQRYVLKDLPFAARLASMCLHSRRGQRRALASPQPRRPA